MAYEYTTYTLNDLDNYNVPITIFDREWLLTCRYNYHSNKRYINIIDTTTNQVLLNNKYIVEFDRFYIDNPDIPNQTVYICLERKVENSITDYHYWSSIFNLCVVPIEVNLPKPVVRYVEKEVI